MVGDMWLSCRQSSARLKPQNKYEQNGRTTKIWQEMFLAGLTDILQEKSKSCKTNLSSLAVSLTGTVSCSLALSLSLNLYQSLFILLLFLPPSHTLSHSLLPPILSDSPSINSFSFGWVLNLVCSS